MEIDLRQMSDRELERIRVRLNGKGPLRVVYANDETGIIEVFKGALYGNILIPIRVTEGRQPGVGESQYNGYITEYHHGFVQIEQVVLDTNQKNT